EKPKEYLALPFGSNAGGSNFSRNVEKIVLLFCWQARFATIDRTRSEDVMTAIEEGTGPARTKTIQQKHVLIISPQRIRFNIFGKNIFSPECRGSARPCLGADC